jgi:hypothetical protein
VEKVLGGGRRTRPAGVEDAPAAVVGVGMRLPQRRRPAAADG